MFLEKIVNTINEIKYDVEYLKKSELPLVLFGNGALASHVRKLLLENKIQISHVVVDDDYYISNSFFHNHPIEREDDVLNLYPKLNVIIAYGNYLDKMAKFKKNPSVVRCIFFEPGAVVHVFVDYYNTVKKHAPELEKFYAQLADEHSRNLMIAFINAKISGNPKVLVNLNISDEQQYFPEFLHLSSEEIFVDCGAYTGDTILSFIKKTQGKYSKIYAFEPDKNNVEKLKKNTFQFNNIDIIEKGCFSCKKNLLFQDGVGDSSAVSSQGNIEIEVDAIDNIVPEKITFIKMDVEGCELEALKGVQNTISSYHPPRLAISLYHRSDDFYTIPQFISTLNDSYKFYLRHYGIHSTELVLYAIPEDTFA